MPEYEPITFSAKRPESLLLYVDTPEAPLAADVANVISATNRAFREYVRSRRDIGHPSGLAVTHLKIGSISAQFVPMLQMAGDSIDLVKAFGELYASRQVIAGFLTHLDTVTKMIQAGVDEVRHWKGARALAKTTARMVTTERARSITYSSANINVGMAIANDNAGRILDGEREIAEREKAGRPRRIEVDLRDGIGLADQYDATVQRPDPYLRDESGSVLLDEEGNPRPANAGPFGGPFGTDNALESMIPWPASDADKYLTSGRPLGWARPAGEIRNYLNEPTSFALEDIRTTLVGETISRDREELTADAIDRNGWTVAHDDGGASYILPITSGLDHLGSDWKVAKVRGYILRLAGRAVAFEVTKASLVR